MSTDSGFVGSKIKYHFKPSGNETFEEFTHVYVENNNIYAAGIYGAGTAWGGTYVVKFGALGGLNIKESHNAESFLLYPNPTTSNFSVRQRIPGNLATGLQIQVRDLYGHLIQGPLTIKTNTAELIDLSLTQKGVYIVEIISEGKMETKKIVICD